MTTEITDTNFEQEVLKSDKLVLIDFWAEWCGPCKQMAPVIDEVAQEVGDSVKVFKMNVDKSQETAAKYGIRSIPTLMIFKDGAPFSTKVGASPKSVIIDWIKEHQ